MGSTLFDKLMRTRRLPTPSATALRILELADDEDTSVVDVADVISGDPALSARILKFANSVELGASGQITTVRQAVMRMGLRAVNVTALSFSLINKGQAAQCAGFDANEFWASSLATAVAARALVKQGSVVLPDEAFVAGLLSEIGKLVLALGAPEEYARVLKRVGTITAPSVDVERSILDTDHVELAASLLKHWNLPEILVEAIRHQLEPTTDVSDPINILSHAIWAGQWLGGHVRSHPRGAVDVIGTSAPGLRVPESEEALATLVESLRPEFVSIAESMSISVDEAPDETDLQSRAADLIAELSMVGEAENQSIVAKNRVLAEKAMTDPLTGAHNRAALDQKLAEELERSRRYGRPLSLVMLDIDHFKQFNDQHGHLVGDDVLKLVVDCCRKTIRDVDFLARYGGEEFVVIAPETDLRQCAVLAERLRRGLEACRYDPDGKNLAVTASLGAAAVTGGHESIDPKRMIGAADGALYEAKRTGRNRCCFVHLEGAEHPDTNHVAAAS